MLSFLKSFNKNKNVGKVIPIDQITPEDLEKLLIRSSLLASSPSLIEQYKDFIAPLYIDVSRNAEGNLKNNKEEKKLFAEFFLKVQKIKENYALLYKQPIDIKLAEVHREQLLLLAAEYCQKAQHQGVSEFIFPQLETIASNIRQRQMVVDYVFHTARRSYGTI